MQRILLIIGAIAFCGCPIHRPITRPVVREQAGTLSHPADTPQAVEVAAAKTDTGPEEVKPTRPPVHPVPPEPPKNPGAVISQISGELRDAFFDYDRAELRADALAALKRDAGLLIPILGEFPELTVIIEGHCDERGSAEYNLGLGAGRSARAVDFLRRLGMPAERLQQVSYGKERPQCTDAAEFCWQRNRRVHLLVRFSASER